MRHWALSIGIEQPSRGVGSGSAALAGQALLQLAAVSPSLTLQGRRSGQVQHHLPAGSKRCSVFSVSNITHGQRQQLAGAKAELQHDNGGVVGRHIPHSCQAL